MHSIETSIILFISFLCIVFLLQSTVSLHDFYKVELYTRFFSVAEDLFLRKKEEKANPSETE